jgi:hypothetical protein
LEIHQEHRVTYADVVVHPDLVAQTIHDIVMDPSKQRATYERPEVSEQPMKTTENPIVTAPVAKTQVASKPDVVDVQEGVESKPIDDASSSVESPVVVEPEIVQESISSDSGESDEASEPLIEASTESAVEIPVASVQSTNAIGSVAAMDPVFKRFNTRLALGLVAGSAYTAFAGYQAIQQIDAANAETGSQSNFDTASTEADFWRNQYVGGMVFSSQVVLAYMTSRILEYRLSQPVSDSIESDVSEGVAP